MIILNMFIMISISKKNKSNIANNKLASITLLSLYNIALDKYILTDIYLIIETIFANK